MLKKIGIIVIAVILLLATILSALAQDYRLDSYGTTKNIQNADILAYILNDSNNNEIHYQAFSNGIIDYDWSNQLTNINYIYGRIYNMSIIAQHNNINTTIISNLPFMGLGLINPYESINMSQINETILSKIGSEGSFYFENMSKLVTLKKEYDTLNLTNLSLENINLDTSDFNPKGIVFRNFMNIPFGGSVDASILHSQDGVLRFYASDELIFEGGDLIFKGDIGQEIRFMSDSNLQLTYSNSLAVENNLSIILAGDFGDNNDESSSAQCIAPTTKKRGQYFSIGNSVSSFDQGFFENITFSRRMDYIGEKYANIQEASIYLTNKDGFVSNNLTLLSDSDSIYLKGNEIRHIGESYLQNLNVEGNVTILENLTVKGTAHIGNMDFSGGNVTADYYFENGNGYNLTFMNDTYWTKTFNQSYQDLIPYGYNQSLSLEEAYLKYWYNQSLALENQDLWVKNYENDIMDGVLTLTNAKYFSLNDEAYFRKFSNKYGIYIPDLQENEEHEFLGLSRYGLMLCVHGGDCASLNWEQFYQIENYLYNSSTSTFNMYNPMWNSTFNQSYQDLIPYGYNQSLSTYEMWNDEWSGGGFDLDSSAWTNTTNMITIAEPITNVNVSDLNATNMFSWNNITALGTVQGKQIGNDYDPTNDVISLMGYTNNGNLRDLKFYWRDWGVIIDSDLGSDLIQWNIPFKMGDNSRLRFGTSNNAYFGYNTAGNQYIGLGVSDGTGTALEKERAFILADAQDINANYDFGHPNYDNPNYIIHSASQSQDEFLRMFHDTSDANIISGKGAIILGNETVIKQLSGTYSDGKASLCVYDNGTIFASDSGC